MSDQAVDADATDVTDATDDLVLRVPERMISPPAFLSAQARAVIAMAPREASYPAIDDVAGWKQHIAQMDEAMLPMISGMAAGVPRP